MNRSPSRRIAVVPAYNEEPTVAAVLDRLYAVVDELVVVDDGSTDGTRAAICAWLPGHERARMLSFDHNQGMSAAYYLAFTDLRRRMAAGEISPDDLVFTVDADGQHELAVLDELERITRDEQLDALIVRRDLSTYPRYKQLGNWVMSTWATLWAGHPLPDVESGYRIFRMGALAHALEYYKGYKYSETVEVAVILCRLGYRVRNDVIVPVPIYRSRTNLKDVLIDLAVMPAAWWRVMALRAKPSGIPRAAAVWLPLAVLLPFVALLALMAAKRIFLGVDAINNYVHVWYLNQTLIDHLEFPLRAAPLENGRAPALPYGGVPWLLGALLYELFGDRGVTLLMVVGLSGVVLAATFVRPAMRSPWMTALFLLNPFFIDAVFSFQLPFVWAAMLFFLYVMMLDRRRFFLAGLLGWAAVGSQPVFGGLAVVAYGAWAFWARPADRPRLAVMAFLAGMALIPVAALTLATPALSDNGRLLILRSLVADIPRRGSILAFPFVVQAFQPVILRRYRLVGGAVAAALLVWLPFANGAFGLAQGNYIAGLLHDPRDPYAAFIASPAFIPGAHYRVLTPNEREEGFLYLARNGGVLASELFTESQFKRSFRPEQYGCFLQAKGVDFVLLEHAYERQYRTNEGELLRALDSSGAVTRVFADADGRYEVYDVRAYREQTPAPGSVAACRLRPPLNLAKGT
jgi:glycosyltransferase involved in cell wall biosynthesis